MWVIIAEWSEENTRIVTELFVVQVQAGHRLNTYLTPDAYDVVAMQFKVRPRLNYTRAWLKINGTI